MNRHAGRALFIIFIIYFLLAVRRFLATVVPLLPLLAQAFGGAS